MALKSLICADVPLRNCSLTHTLHLCLSCIFFCAFVTLSTCVTMCVCVGCWPLWCWRLSGCCLCQPNEN